MEKHSWSKFFDVDNMDSTGTGLVLDIPNCKIIKKNYIGKNLINYDSLLVLFYFKGHLMGGYGGSIKQFSIGYTSSSVHNMFKNNITYINVMTNILVYYDCCTKAEEPCMKDIGILASIDPIAIYQACIDLVYNSADPGKNILIERIESRHGIHTIEAASQLDFGSREYELIKL